MKKMKIYETTKLPTCEHSFFFFFSRKLATKKWLEILRIFCQHFHDFPQNYNFWEDFHISTTHSDWNFQFVCETWRLKINLLDVEKGFPPKHNLFSHACNSIKSVFQWKTTICLSYIAKLFPPYLQNVA